MNKEKALKLLRGGQDGVAKWNRWRGLADPNLTNANLPHANLTNADLTGSDLSNANLSNANLTNADLTGATLINAKLIDADLTNANLAHADLTHADLSGAYLPQANLSHASFFRANLNEADFSRADLTDAILGHTTLALVDLSTVGGLETVQHLGPSDVGVHTLYESDGKIPDVFLRGCGLPEELITYHKSLVGSAIDFYSCFISYSHADKAFARRLHDALQGRGIRCWLDEHQLLPGDDVHEQIDRGIRLWDKVVLCASESSLTSWWVDNEVNKAFTKEASLMKDKKKKLWSLIPLNLDGYLFSGDYGRGWKDQVTSRLAADFTGWKTDSDKFDQQLEKPVRALRADDGEESRLLFRSSDDEGESRIRIR